MKRLLALALLGAASSPGQSPADKMKASTVLIAIAAKVNGQLKVTGTLVGFVVGDRKHVVTSWIGCCKPRQDGVATIPVVVLGEKQVFRAEPVAVIQTKDVAILEMENVADRPPADLAPGNFLSEGQKVYVLGFATDEERKQGAPAGVRISETTSAPRKAGDMKVLQLGMNFGAGNVGGPVFDDCDRVVGVVSAVKGGQSQFAIQADEIIAAAAQGNVNLAVANDACTGGDGASAAGEGSGGGSGGTGGGGGEGGGDGGGGRTHAPTLWDRLKSPQMIGVALAIGILLLLSRKDTRQQIGRAVTGRGAAMPMPMPILSPTPTPMPMPYGGPPAPAPPPAPVRKPPRPVLRGISGYYAGKTIELEDRPWILGRDPHAANLVFPSDSQSISRKHCTIRYDASAQAFLLQDAGSSNGTYGISGEQIKAGQPRMLRSGDRFYLGDPTNVFEVGLKTD